MTTRRGYLFKRNGIFYVQWRAGGKLFSKSTRTGNAKDAEKERAKIMAPFAVGDAVDMLNNVKAAIESNTNDLARIHDEQTPALKIEDAFKAYLKNPERPDSGDATLNHYDSFFKRFKVWLSNKHKWAVYVNDVSRDIASDYAKHLTSEGVTASTFNQHIGFLRLMWKTLADAARVTDNPWGKIKRKKVMSPSRRELTMDELRRVCQSAQGEMRYLFGLGIYTGLRLGDCATLRWAEVDMNRNQIRRVPMKVSRRNPNPITIPIHNVLKIMLMELSPSQSATYLLPKTAALYNRGADQLSRAITAHFHANGICTIIPGTGGGTGKRAVVEVGFHSLRHTFVSLCRGANAPLAVVETLVGHASPAMTRHYTHISEIAAASAVDALPSILADAPVKALPAKQPLPAWARDKLSGMTAKNWKTIRDELITEGGIT